MFFLVLTGLMTVLAVYIGVRLIRPLPLAAWIRWLLFLFVLLSVNKMAIFRFFVPGGFAPQLSWEVLLFSGWLHTSVVLTFLVCLLLDVLGIIFRRAAVRLFGPVLRACVIFGAGMLLSAYGLQQAAKVPDVVTLDVDIPGLPADLEGFRIAQLTDLHLGPLFDAAWARELVVRTNAAKPDMIVVVGDVVDGSPSQLAASVAELSQLHAPYGLWLAMGNHEYYSGLDQWLKEFSRLGLTSLLNRHAVISVGTSRLVVAGVADRVTLRSAVGGGMPGERTDLAAALRGAPERGPDTLRILLDHQPSGARDNAPHVDLQLSGHTHGGMLLPLQKIVAAFNNGYVSGRYDVDGMRLIVANGAGLWAGLALRIGVPSQILVLRLIGTPVTN